MTLDELIKKLEESIKVDSREEEAWLETQDSKKLITDFVAQELLSMIGEVESKNLKLEEFTNDTWKLLIFSRAEELKKEI